jgi:hypothetical protein
VTVSIEDRVGEVEREQARQGVELASLRGQVSEVGSDVKKLLAQEAGRPTPLTGMTILATLGSLGAAAGVVWWLIGNAPAVQDLDRRLTRLDDPEIGRVRAIERKVDTLTGWGAKVTRGK